VAFVPLQPVPTADELPAAIGSALGLSAASQGDPLAQLIGVLHDQPALVVLDNFEHLMAGASLVVRLLAEAPGLRLLVTSREALNVPGEWAYDLGGLGTDAPALFRQGARRVRADFAPSAAEADAIAHLCRLVAGMPLAVELAAAWVRVLTCAEIAAEIERDLHFLETQAREMPERHRSLTAVCAYSWKLLEPDEQRGLRQLAVFRGGFGREAALAVAGAGLSTLAALVAKSLVRRVERQPGEAGGARYDLHEFIRQYAVGQLAAAGETEAASDRHLDYWSRRAAESAPRLYSAAQAEALAAWEAEHDNLRAALRWALETGPRTPARVAGGLRLITQLERFWQGRGHLREARQWLLAGLRRRAGLPPAAQAEALNTLGWLENQIGAPADAIRSLTESLTLYRAAGDQAGLAAALDSLGDLAWSTGHDRAQAAAHYTESLALRRTLGDPAAIGLSLYSLGRLYVDDGQFDRAAAPLNEALAVLESCGDQRGVALTLNALGRLDLFAGRLAEAGPRLRAALERFAALGNRVDIAEALEELAQLAAAEGRPARGAELCGAADGVRVTVGVASLAQHAQFITALRAALGDAAFTAAWSAGRALSESEAVALALGTHHSPPDT
jgi:predicted ATPase